MSKKILMIDDEEDLIFILSIRLKSLGYDFISALNRTEGIDKIKKENPDLILLDILMPGIDGYEVERRLREEKINIPIIFVTAMVDAEKKHEYIRKLGYKIIIKPFNTEELIKKICSELESRYGK